MSTPTRERLSRWAATRLTRRGTERPHELVVDFRRGLEAFCLDVRSHVHVQHIRRGPLPLRAVCFQEGADRFCRNLRHHTAPASVDDRESTAGRHDNDRHAVCKAEQARDACARDDDTVSPFVGCLLDARGGGRLIYRQDHVAMNLVRHDQRKSFCTERFHRTTTVFPNACRIVLHVGAKVQRRVRPCAHAARSTYERNAHARLAEESFVGQSLERRKTTLGKSWFHEFQSRLFHDRKRRLVSAGASGSQGCSPRRRNGLQKTKRSYSSGTTGATALPWTQTGPCADSRRCALPARG